jgi:hypothetical protein
MRMGMLFNNRKVNGVGSVVEEGEEDVLLVEEEEGVGEWVVVGPLDEPFRTGRPPLKQIFSRISGFFLLLLFVFRPVSLT